MSGTLSCHLICHNNNNILSTAWIDYKKAFDNVLHSWIIISDHLYKIFPLFINFLASAMKQWETTLLLSKPNGILAYGNIKINSGIFKGDSLFPLLFCLPLFPLTKIINNSQYGYKMKNNKINHLFYMDDLKLYASNDNELEGLIKTAKVFSDNIGMQFGLEKCAKASFKRDKLVKTSNIIIDNETIIKGLEQEKSYKYLGVNKGDGIQHAKMKEQMCIRRGRLITKAKLNPKKQNISS